MQLVDDRRLVPRAFDRADDLVRRLEWHGFTDVERHDMTHWQRVITHTFAATRP